jgi:hypothetical protein
MKDNSCLKPMSEAIHHWFCAVSYHYTEYNDHYTVTLPHLVGFRPDPNDPETQTIEYQQAEVVDNVKAVIHTSNLSGLSLAIKPNGRTEDGKNWYQFEVIITIPKSSLGVNNEGTRISEGVS